MRVEDFEGRVPTLAPERYFEGRVRAWGIFEDRFGTLRRQFTVIIDGTWDGQTLVLTEDFSYDDGKTERRVWSVSRIDAHTYEATADSIVGKATGHCAGNAIHWTYTMALPLRRRELKVRFSDWMFQQDRDVVINRATVSKFGVRIGSTTIFFLRDKAPETVSSGLDAAADCT